MTKTICGTGHRPQHISSFGTAKDDIKKFISENNVGKVISGMALGYDTILAEAVIELKEQGAELILEAAVPCNNQDCKWLEKDRIKYKNILSKCDTVTLLQQEYTADCLQNRNKYMVDNSDIILAYWNGKQNGGTYNCIKYAKSKNKKIVNIYKEEKTMKRTLQCHSKGDKRFSALYAQVEINGVVDTIERWYQGCKRDLHGECVGKGQPVDHIVWKGVKRPASDLTPLYEWLWRQYFTQNPQLLVEAAKYDEFVDIFKGKSINCQADIIKKLVIEYKKNKEEEKKMKKIKNNWELYTSLSDKQSYFTIIAFKPNDTMELDSTIENLNKILDTERYKVLTTKGLIDIKESIPLFENFRKELENVPVRVYSSKSAYKAMQYNNKIDIASIKLNSIVDNIRLYYLIKDNAPEVYFTDILLENNHIILDIEELVYEQLKNNNFIIEVPLPHNIAGGPDYNSINSDLLNIRNYINKTKKCSFTKATCYDQDISGEYYSSIAEKVEDGEVKLRAEKYEKVNYLEYIRHKIYSKVLVNLTNAKLGDYHVFTKGWVIPIKNSKTNKIIHYSYTNPVIEKYKGVDFMFNGNTKRIYDHTGQLLKDLETKFREDEEILIEEDYLKNNIVMEEVYIDKDIDVLVSNNILISNYVKDNVKLINDAIEHIIKSNTPMMQSVIKRLSSSPNNLEILEKVLTYLEDCNIDTKKYLNVYKIHLDAEKLRKEEMAEADTVDAVGKEELLDVAALTGTLVEKE